MLDEDFGVLKNKDFARYALSSDNCFIIIIRESLLMIPYSYKEIYKIHTSGKFHSLERMYPNCEEFQEKECIVTEDEDAGYEYYHYFYGEKVISSHGNSNLSQYSSSDCLLIGDGCAIGAYIQNLDNMSDEKYACPERYCAELLAFITRNTPAQYTKSKLNECYTKPSIGLTRTRNCV